MDEGGFCCTRQECRVSFAGRVGFVSRVSFFVADEPGAAVVAEDEVGLVDGEVAVIVVGAEGDLNARGEGGEDFGADVHESREVIPSREGDVRRAFGVGVVTWRW